MHLDVIAFSCYIWNIDEIKELCSMLKKESQVTIILGGPEVTYEPEILILFLMKIGNIDIEKDTLDLFQSIKYV